MVSSRIPKKRADDLVLMRESCRITAEVLDAVGGIIKAGVSTEEINTFVHNMITARGGVPSTLNYKGYTKSCCTSINDVVCHGIPSPFVVLKDGDIINVDVTTYKGGFHGDSSRMYFVGGPEATSPANRELVAVTKECLYRGIREVRPGARIGDIGAAIQEYIKSLKRGYGIVREYTGHGVGREFHEPPQVVHIGRRGFGDEMAPGMTFTIEPMINLGTAQTILSRVDGWTVRTGDGKASAQWEHTVHVTADGVEVMTLSAAERALLEKGELKFS